MRGFILFSGLEEFDFSPIGAAPKQLCHAKNASNELIVAESCRRVTRYWCRNNTHPPLQLVPRGFSQRLNQAMIPVLP